MAEEQEGSRFFHHELSAFLPCFLSAFHKPTCHPLLPALGEIDLLFTQRFIELHPDHAWRGLSARAGCSPVPSHRSRMAMKRSTKKTLITKHRTHAKDTGSPQVQIAILTKEIKLLTSHLKDHKKDHSARRGLLGKVAQRRKLLMYLRMNKPEQYQDVLEVHGLKR